MLPILTASESAAINPLQGIYDPAALNTPADLSTFNQGQYRQISTGEVFYLKQGTDTLGNPLCQLKNAAHYYECSPAKLASDFVKISPPTQ